MLIVLTVTRMGAKVEAESYNPGYYATGDLHMDSNGWRSPYYEDKTSNGQLCNGFMTKQADSYSEYDNEMLKRTMLSHEAMFRQQVYELHRVYKIQRDLMKHYENKDTYAYPVLADASQTNSSSQVPPNGSKMIWQIPLVAKTYGEATVAVHTDTNHSLKFLSDGSALPSPNGFPSNGVALNTKQGTIDLELPADHYIDDDNTSNNKPIDFLGVDSDTKPPNDAGVTFSGAEGLGRFSDNSSTSGLLTTNKPGGCHVGDLNEPITGMHMGGTNGSVSRGLPYTLENSWRQSAVRSSTANFGFNKEYSKEKHTDEGTSSNFLDASAKLRQEEKPLIDKGKQVSNQSFFTPRYSNADLQKSFKVSDGRSATNEFIYHGQNSSVGWFSKGPMGASAVNNFARLDHPHHSSIGTLVAPISIPHIDHHSAASPIGSCTVDPRSSVINNAAFQRVPSFNGSSTVNSYKSPSAVTQSIGPSIHKLKRFDNLDGSYFGFPLDPFSASRSRQQVPISSELEQRNCRMFEHSAARQSHGYPQSTNGKGTKNFNLNEALSDGLEEFVEQDGRSVGSLQHSKGEGSVFGISWLQNKATCADPTGLEKQRKVFGHSNGTATDAKNNNDLTGTAPVVCNLSDSASTSLGCRIKIDDASESITDRSWLVCNKTVESTTRHLPLPSQKPLDRDGQAAEGVVKKSGAVIRNLFDLNDDVPHEDNSESSVVSHECDVASLQNNHAKRTFLIDLEEMPACEDGAAWTSQQECTPSGKFDACKESDMCFPSATDAAQIILALSTDVPTTTVTPDDMLQWFAELAISSTDAHADEQAEAQGCINNFSDNGSDSFEALTLKLEECKTDERWTPEPPLTDDEQAVSTVNLLSKPKRGPQRKRRQKRNFQKDILPGLSSLSRPKIIEDIQLIEGLVQASGGSWESSLTRRARGGRTRSRKPRKNEPATVEIEAEAEASPPLKSDSIGLEADERGMVSWGRTTRRCRKPRCPSGNNIAASS